MRNKPKGPNTSQWTFAKYLAEIYIPQKQQSAGLTDRTAEWYRHLAVQLQKCFGRPPRLRELNDDKLARFEAWTIERGCTKKTARERRWMAKAVLRHWRPEEHPDAGRRGGACLRFLEVDVGGSLENIFQNHYLPERPDISSPNTITQYGRALRIFTEFLGHTATLADLTDQSIGRFLRWRVATGVCARTANGEAKQIKALWNWAAKKRFVEQFPTIGKLPEPEVVPKAWTREQLAELIAACRNQGGVFDGISAADYWLAFHLVLWDTGERTGAMLALAWTMLDSKTGYLTVPAEIRKGRQKAMVYRLKPGTLAALEKIRRNDCALIFYMARLRDRFQVLYKRLILSAGLPYLRHKSGPQKMRRTFSSFITAAGGDATAALRHSTRRVTEESYNDPTIANPEPPNALLFDLEGGAA